MRSIFFCAVFGAILGGCTGSLVEQPPEKQAIADAFHARIMQAASQYRAESGRKVMFGCIKWPKAPETEPELLTYSAYYLPVRYAYRSSAIMDHLRRETKGECDSRKSKHNLECECIKVDENDRNAILVP